MRTRSRGTVRACLVGAAVAAVLPASPTLAVVPPCPAAFDLLTFEQAFALPQTQIAFERGLITPEALLPIYEGFDANDNGVLCVRGPFGWSQSAVENKDALLKFKDDVTS